jgi:hypothetical protein
LKSAIRNPQSAIEGGCHQHLSFFALAGAIRAFIPQSAIRNPQWFPRARRDCRRRCSSLCFLAIISQRRRLSQAGRSELSDE